MVKDFLILGDSRFPCNKHKPKNFFISILSVGLNVGIREPLVCGLLEEHKASPYAFVQDAIKSTNSSVNK